MKYLTLGIISILFVAFSGCAAVYTSIEETGEGTYLVTKTRQGIWRLAGSVYSCQVTGEDSMDCTRIDEP